MIAFLAQPVMIALYIVLGLIVAGSLFRYFMRRRALHAIKRFPISMVDNPSPIDIEAYEGINKIRSQAWQRWAKSGDLSPRVFNELFLDIVRGIAAVYHPNADKPHLKARIGDLLELNIRTYYRVLDILQKPYLRKLQRLDIETALSVQRGFGLIMGNPLVRLIRDKRFRAHFRRMFDALNIVNPWYWLRRLLTEYSMDLAVRYLLTGFVTIVGEEAVLLYGRRKTIDTDWQIERAVFSSGVNMLTSVPAISSKEYQLFCRRILQAKALGPDEKVEILTALARGKKALPFEKSMDEVIEAGGQKQALDFLEELALAEGPFMAEKEQAFLAVRDYLGSGEEGRRG
jgi:hypothetical protein